MNARAPTLNASIRAFHTTNPSQPQEVAHYIPQIPEGADANDGMYVVDRLQGGLYILELNV